MTGPVLRTLVAQPFDRGGLRAAPEGHIRTERAWTSTEDTVEAMARLVRQYRSAVEVRDVAVKITRRLPHMRSAQLMAEAVHHWIRRHIRYVHDPADVEMVASPDWTIRHGYGDCDDQAVVAAALLAALGVEVGFKIIAQREKGDYDHVYVAYRAEGAWQFLDPTIAAPPGADPYKGRVLSEKLIPITNETENVMSGAFRSGFVDGGPASNGNIIGGSDNDPWWVDLTEAGIDNLSEIIRAIKGNPPINPTPGGGGGGNYTGPPMQQQAGVSAVDVAKYAAIGGGIAALVYAAAKAIS